jgi:hypothetical protein
MVAFTSFMSAISMVLLASTATAAPSVEKRDNPAVELTLYAPPASDPTKCWNNAKEIHLRTGDLNKDGLSPCYTVDYSTFEIWGQHGLNCHRKTSFAPRLLSPLPFSQYFQRSRESC